MKRAKEALLVGVISLVSFSCRAEYRETGGHTFIERESPPMLSVTGTAEVSAPPDLVLIRMGAEKVAPQVADAQTQVNAAMRKAVETLRGAGVAEEDLQTSQLRIEPEYAEETENNQKQRKQIGFRASNELDIRVHDLAKVASMIDAAVSAGVNKLEDVSFQLKDDRDLRREALKQAAEDARKKADALAASGGVKIVSIDGIDEGSVEYGRQSLFGGSGGQSSPEEATVLQAGRVRLNASVNVRYRISQ